MAAAAAAEPGIILESKSACARRHQEQAEIARAAVIAGKARGDDKLRRRAAVDDSDLGAVEPPAVRHLPCRGPDMGEVEARGAFRMCKRQRQSALGNLPQHLLLLRLGAAAFDQ